MSKGLNRIPLTEEQFKLLRTTVDWHIDEVPKQNWSMLPKLVRPDDTFAVYASGAFKDPKILNDISAVAGFDVLAYEPRPNLEAGEPGGNAYHYVVQQLNRSDYPYLMVGPFKSETIVSHWFDAPELDKYWQLEKPLL